MFDLTNVRQYKCSTLQMKGNKSHLERQFLIQLKLFFCYFVHRTFVEKHGEIFIVSEQGKYRKRKRDRERQKKRRKNREKQGKNSRKE